MTTREKGKWWPKVLWGALGLVVLLIAGGIIFYFNRPLAVYRYFQARVMADAGGQSRVATVNGTSYHYVEAGSGPTIMLVHGLGANKENWYSVFGALTKRYHVVAVDLLGFGQSKMQVNDYSLDHQASSLAALIEKQGWAPAVLVGNSMGGWIACKVALQHPETVKALILANSGGVVHPDAGVPNSLPPQEIFALLQPKNRRETKELLRRMMARHPNLPGYILDDLQRTLAAENVRRTMFSVTANDFLDSRLPELKQPTLILWGEKDQLAGLGYAEAFHRGVPGSTLEVLPGCGHTPQVECPASFEKVVLRHLAAIFEAQSLLPNENIPVGAPR